MATGFEFFERDLKLATAGMEPEAINKAVAVFAKQEVRRVISEGIASPRYDRFVNAVQGAPEEAYKAPGAIVYEFVNWPLVINAVLEELQRRAPRKSGRFAASFIVIVAGRVVADLSSITGGQEVLITNAQPYVRKAEVGRLGIPTRRLFDGTKSAMARRFAGAFKFETRFLNISGGVDARIPYLLKRSGRGKDRRAGQPITYPAIIVNVL